MLYRTLAILVVGFWLTMIGLLIRKEAGPSDSALREVPVGHIVKLLLMHEQPSDLYISSDKLRLGQLRIHPHRRKDERSRVFDIIGDLQIMVPGMERQRMSWSGELELEKTLAVHRFTMELKFRDLAMRGPLADAYRAEITIAPPENLLIWTISNGNPIFDQPRSYTLDEAGLQKALRDIEPTLPQMLQSQTKNMAPPVIKARQSSMLIHGERIDTYLVTIEQSGQTLLSCDVSQLGQILRAKTLIGYSLAAEDLGP